METRDQIVVEMKILWTIMQAGLDEAQVGHRDNPAGMEDRKDKVQRQARNYPNESKKDAHLREELHEHTQ